MLSNIQSILKNKSKLLIICLILVSAISFLTYFYNYVNPPNLFWDENYHIASAYKYINHVFFMEPHPPLGKLFIAWGEQLFQSNNKLDTSSFAVTDYIKDIPNGFSFVGVRFFPALFGALSGPLFFLILYLLFPNVVLAFFFSFLYLFDNAIIVHSRGAMLDSSGIFFSLLVVLYFIVLQKKKIIPIASYGILGILTGLVLSVKINGIIFGMLFLFLLVKEIKYKMSLREEKRRSNLDGIAHNDIQIIQKTILYVLGVVVIFCAVYYIHISNGRNVMDNKYYEASERLKNVLAVHQMSEVAILQQRIDKVRYECFVMLEQLRDAAVNGAISLDTTADLDSTTTDVGFTEAPEVTVLRQSIHEEKEKLREALARLNSANYVSY